MHGCEESMRAKESESDATGQGSAAGVAAAAATVCAAVCSFLVNLFGTFMHKVFSIFEIPF